MLSIAETLNRLQMLFARSREGLNQEEAKKLFFRFRDKGKPKPDPSEPAEPSPEGGQDLSRQMITFMRDTAQKLDRIEADIDYLKEQVDKILMKI